MAAITPVADPVYTHVLSVPFTIGKSEPVEIAEIAIRKPTGKDLLDIGCPVNFDPLSGRPPTLNLDVSYAMTARLSNIPANVLQRADPADLVDLFWMLSTFFTKGLQGWLAALEKQKEALSDPPTTQED